MNITGYKRGYSSMVIFPGHRRIVTPHFMAENLRRAVTKAAASAFEGLKATPRRVVVTVAALDCDGRRE